MKILMLNPPYFPLFSRSSRSPSVAKSSTLYYPFFLSYAAGVLEDAGFEVCLIDAPAEGLTRKAVIERIHNLRPDMAVCETSTPSIENDMEVAGEIKAAGVPFVAAVGTHVSALPEEVLSRCSPLDVAVRREYEYTIRELARRLEKEGPRMDPEGIEGVSFRRDGAVMHNADRPLIENLDELPFVSRVYRDHLRRHIKSYFYGANMYPLVTILSGRGCIHRCAYCVYPQTMTGNLYRLRGVANLVDEFEFVKRELPEVREIFIEDDTLTVDRSRARAIAEEIIRRGLRITWSANSRPDVDFDTMKLMRKAGCRLFCVGFESASREILKGLGKHTEPDNYMKFRKDAARAGILIHGCFMYGNEGETPATMRRTLEMAKRLNCDTAQFYPIMVYPGTRAYNEYKKKGYIKSHDYREWLTPEGLHNCVVSLPGISSRELVEFCDLSRKEFYLRPGYILSKITQIISRPSEMRRILRSANSLRRYLFRPLKKKHGRRL